MLARQIVPPRKQRVENGAMLEPPRGREISLIVRLLINIQQHLVHAAVLDLEHRLQLLGSERRRDVVHPVR
jgi:hypothetical protein